MKPSEIAALPGQEVTVTTAAGATFRAWVTGAQLHRERIDVTQERKFYETGEREYMNGMSSLSLTLDVSRLDTDNTRKSHYDVPSCAARPSLEELYPDGGWPEGACGEGEDPSPKFPEGTPEYEAYRAELKTELSKFARGEEPYPYPDTTPRNPDHGVPPRCTCVPVLDMETAEPLHAWSCGLRDKGEHS